MAVPILRRNHGVGSHRLESVVRRNSYLTDESRLFRCLGWDGSLVLLEDCGTLEAFAFPADELAAIEMRLVKPAPAR
ncbi:MAG TPA: hypothetical protein VFI86_10090 [Burkholderiales bacterium]|nr:hypothetical protein [Burkholderiales bacterium]